MNPATIEQHRRPPSALAFMTRALLRFPRLPVRPKFPLLVERWTGVRIGGSHEASFHQATGRDARCVLYPHVLGFRLQMALLTHPAFPLPIWNALQTRNRLVRHTPLDHGSEYDFETGIGGHREVEKGIEVDLHTRLVSGDRCDWESTITYFYRGRFGPAEVNCPQPALPDLSAAVEVAKFQTPGSGRWAFGGLTGDYNGIHLWRCYARRFGFPTAFMHPQRAAGLCLDRLGQLGGEPGTLILWIKGPVFYDADAILIALRKPDALDFGLSLAGDARHALMGSWSIAA
ncbi:MULTISPECIES: acyl dehydratase [Bradyrhizobium]|uniref:acyl dehydratase n=1 Tax=Bradyrhizobium TaxID=374 RepID=UPI000A5C5215|nr:MULTISPECIES: acyl dehydratase [Bradyrhizobium]